MADLVDLEWEREKRMPNINFPVQCVVCGDRWEVITPLPAPNHFDCTRCLAAPNEMAEALRPFAECAAQIADTEDDEEWAKFRLLVKDYRRAARAICPSNPSGNKATNSGEE